MEIIGSLLTQLDLFLLVFTRISGMFTTAPILGNSIIPGRVRIGLAALLTILVFPSVQYPTGGLPDALIPFVLSLGHELMLGLAIGLIASLAFFAVQLAGEMIDMQMGFAMVNVIDPLFGIQVPLMGNFLYILALMALLLTNGHHLLLWGIQRSFAIAPAAGFGFTGAGVQTVIDNFAGLLAVALSLSAPVIGILLITSIGMGIISRTMPQMNVYFVEMPLKIIVGFIVLVFMLPLYGLLLENLFGRMTGYIIAFLNVLTT